MPYTHVVETLKNKQEHIAKFLKQTIAMPMGILHLSAVLEGDIEDVDIRILD